MSLGPTSIIDSIRTTLWHQSVFGSAYALKVTMNNAYVIHIWEGSIYMDGARVYRTRGVRAPGRVGIYVLGIDGQAKITNLLIVGRMSIIIRIITGALQDADNDSYRRVVRVYLFLAAGSVAVGLAILIGALVSEDLAPLQWTRKQRLARGEGIVRIREKHLVTHYRRSRWIALGCFSALMLLTLGSWVAYIWGAVTGYNS